MHRYHRMLWLTALVAGASVAWAQTPAAPTPPAPFAAGNARLGKTIVDRDCVSCHAQRFAGDPDQMYKRADHRIKTPGKLLAQVQACNVNLGKGYFPEEEEHIAAYLNLEFYQFKP
jgi:cytochrome c553